MNYRRVTIIVWNSCPKHNQIQKERKRLAKHETTITIEFRFYTFLNCTISQKLEPESVGSMAICKLRGLATLSKDVFLKEPLEFSMCLTLSHGGKINGSDYFQVRTSNVPNQTTLAHFLPLFRLTFIFLTGMIAWIFIIKQIDQRRANPPGRPPTCFSHEKKKNLSIRSPKAF